MHFPSTTSLVLAAIGLLVLCGAPTVTGNCQLETVKMHAYHACDYIGEQLYQDHIEGRARARRHSMHHPPHSSASSGDDTESTSAVGSETTQVHHHFKRRYQRPTHLSIRNLSDGYLVTDYAYAHILRKHPSHKYKIMPTHFHNNNGTLERLPTHRESHHRRSGGNHHHHPHVAAATATATTTDDNMDNEVLADHGHKHRRTRRNANVAVSSCCSDIERCLHMICPLS